MPTIVITDNRAHIVLYNAIFVKEITCPFDSDVKKCMPVWKITYKMKNNKDFQNKIKKRISWNNDRDIQFND